MAYELQLSWHTNPNFYAIWAVFIWAIPPVRLGLSGRNSGKIPERPRKRSQSVSSNFPREYGWDVPFEASRAFPKFSPPPQYGWGRLFFSEVVPERASQSCSWNSQQYWGYFWLLGVGVVLNIFIPANQAATCWWNCLDFLQGKSSWKLTGTRRPVFTQQCVFRDTWAILANARSPYRAPEPQNLKSAF